MAKKNTFELDNNTVVEVVMTKKMGFGDYKRMLNQAKQKGWNVQSYQIRFYSTGYKNKNY